MSTKERRVYMFAWYHLCFVICIITLVYVLAIATNRGETTMLTKILLLSIGYLFVLGLFFSQILIVEGNRLTRIFYLFLRKEFALTDIVSVTVQKETDLYGTIRHIEVLFKDDDVIKYYMGTVPDTKDFVERLRQAVPDKIDPAVYEFTNKPY